MTASETRVMPPDMTTFKKVHFRSPITDPFLLNIYKGKHTYLQLKTDNNNNNKYIDNIQRTTKRKQKQNKKTLIQG